MDGDSILRNTSLSFGHVVLLGKRGPICHILVIALQLQNGPFYASLRSGGSWISPRWRRQPSEGGGVSPTYDFAKFSQKLKEIERIWTLEGVGVARSKVYCVDPPL